MVESTSIPVVSFEKFLTGDRTAQKVVARQVYDAFSSVGFIYLKDHGIPQTRVEEIFRLVSLAQPAKFPSYSRRTYVLGTSPGRQPCAVSLFCLSLSGGIFEVAGFFL